MEKLKAWSELCDALKFFGTVLMSGEVPEVKQKEAPKGAPAATVKKAKAKKAPEPEPMEDDIDVVDVSEMKMQEDDFENLDFEEEKEEAPAPAITAIDLRYALVDYAKKNGKDAAYAVLGKFGAKRVDDLKESEYPKVLAALKK